MTRLVELATPGISPDTGGRAPRAVSNTCIQRRCGLLFSANISVMKNSLKKHCVIFIVLPYTNKDIGWY